MREAKPLTADEIDDLVRCNYFSTRLGRQIFATIEQQAEHFGKLQADKREIENAAYRHAASIAASHVKRFNGLQIAEAIEALIQRPTQKETSHEH